MTLQYIKNRVTLPVFGINYCQAIAVKKNYYDFCRYFESQKIMKVNDELFMRRAIELSIQNVDNQGGPFGAVIVKDGKIVATGVNRVTSNNDPTAHAEVMAIREAAQKLNDFNLTGCTIYTSCEPCPMCLSAIYWARIDKIYYGNTKTDAKNIGFDDSFIYEEIEKPVDQRAIETHQLLHNEALSGFKKWEEFEGKTEY